MTRKKVPVALISMPFAPILTPSLGLGLLKAALDRADIPAKQFYFGFRFAEMISEPLYSAVSQDVHTHNLPGDWIFSNSLFNHQSADDVDRYIRIILKEEPRLRLDSYSLFPPPSEEIIDGILKAREKVEPFLDECLDELLGYDPEVVGFTSVFMQHIASLSLAKRLKALRPDTFIVFGGANCEGDMGKEVIRQFPFVDAAVSGEADTVFPELVTRVLSNRPWSALERVFGRGRAPLPLFGKPASHSAGVEDMDALPIPDFDDYFDQLGQSSLDLSGRLHLPFETSRGCWWGEKHHCTFCGLNGEAMAHRSKTANRALEEIIYLSNRYPGLHMRATDNILDMNYFKDFIPALAESGLGLKFFYEVKSNLRKGQVRLLRAAGITSIQPGIESFSDKVLLTMLKGVKGLQNIQLLKWCKELGVAPEWNILWGFPGEPAEEYSYMAELIPLLTHLDPPISAATIRIDRFSPNFFQAEELGFKNLLPYPAYNYVYPFEPDVIANLAYYFTFEYQEHQDVLGYVKDVAAEVDKWQACHKESALFSVEHGDRLLVWDSRPIAKDPLTILNGLRRFIYLDCDEVRTPRQIAEKWRSHSGEPVGLDEITSALEDFTAARLMIKQNESYLALAVAG